MTGLIAVANASEPSPTQIAAAKPSRMYIGRRSATEPKKPAVIFPRTRAPINATSDIRNQCGTVAACSGGGVFLGGCVLLASVGTAQKGGSPSWRARPACEPDDDGLTGRNSSAQSERRNIMKLILRRGVNDG